MYNIVIPMAGAGSRFAKAGFTDPKPLISVLGRPMIQVVVNNLAPTAEHRFIFICQRQHVEAYGLREKLTSYALGCEIIELDGMTEGAACTVLTAAKFIDNDAPLMIANSDQYVDVDINTYLQDMDERKLDGLIMTMSASDPKWSFVALDDAAHVTRVVEKEVISSEATVGIYNFRRGADFVAAANEMIGRNERVNGEFYVAPVYNRLIARGQKIGAFNIGDDDGNGMHGLGIPEDLAKFVANPLAKAWLA